MHEKLQNANVAVSAVAGMGGVGKTELATRYARKHEADYPGGICWLNARESNLAAGIIQFAQLYMNLEVPQKRGESPLNLIQQVEWCWQHWQPADGLVLVVLDDITDLRSCQGVLPTANRFRVLMTTRLRGLDSNFVPISLDVLPADKALELLASVLGEKDRRLQREPQTAEELCKWLGYLPLGLELVGRYLAEDPDLSLAEMLERLKAQGVKDEAIDLDEQQMQDTFSTAQRGVRAAFELSWQELEPLTRRVAEYLSLFAPTMFLWEWIASDTELLNCSKLDINAAKKQLYKRHLIERVDEREGGYKIHTLIREFLEVKLAASEQADEFRQTFAAAFVEIAKVIPQSPTRDLIESVKDFIPHLEEVAQNLTDALSDDDLVWSFIGLCRFYTGQGLYALAEPWYQQCLELSQRFQGEEHPDVAIILNNLALIYKTQGRYAEAEPLYRKALELRKRLLGEEHPDVAGSLNNLAELYKAQGRYQQAAPLYVQALELSKRFKEEHPIIATTLNNLAGIYYAQRRFAEAEALYVQALESRKRLLGEEQPDVVSSLNNLAGIYYAQGRFAEAEPLFLQALEIKKRLLVEDHPSIATSLNNLALLYNSQGRFAEAEPLFLQALEMSKRLLGEEHPDVAQSLNNLAALYNSQGRFAEAEPLFLQALEMRQRLLGEEHPDVVTSLNNLALLYNSQGRYSEAEPLFLQALALSERVLGDGHPKTINVRQNLANFWRRGSSGTF